jgi:hypothetical protein
MLPPDLVALAIGFEAVASGRDLRGVVSVVLHDYRESQYWLYSTHSLR